MAKKRRLSQSADGVGRLSLFKGPYSVIAAAELLGEIGDCRGRYPTRDALAGDAGQAAVGIQSGKHKAASFRWASLGAGLLRLSDRPRP
ncbi:MAG: transposase [Solirubrobacteraceae bacterium]